MKILLVEDDLEISKLLAEFLQENGYEVFCQYDGLHVLDCLRENKIDLILLDIMLPYRNGDTVLTAVRECSTVPIIVISAKGTTQNKVDLLRLGADPVHLQRCWPCPQSALQAVMSMIPVNRKFLRGDIYYANLEPHLGSEQGGIRPVVVVQNNTANCYSPNLIVAPVTSNTAKKPDHQAHVLVDGNRAFLQPSMILAESVQTISKGRLIRPMGRLSIPELIRLNYALLYQLDLNEWVWRKEAYERYLRYHR